MKPSVVISRRLPDSVEATATEMFSATLPDNGDMDFATALTFIRETKARGVLFATNFRLDADAIAQLPEHLEVAATCSVGFDHIDVPAARARGLLVTNTPGVLTECTADFAFLLILNACRRAGEYAAVIRDGWQRPFGTAEMLGRGLGGRTLGIVGMGQIGRAVVRRARPFGLKIAYHDRVRLPFSEEAEATYFAELTDMLPHCDILSLHAPATRDNHHLLDREMLALLPEGAVLVNTARGELLDEEALFAALDSGRLAAAGLDVFANEPNIDPRFLRYPQLFLTPHMASATDETRSAMGLLALRNIAAVLSGGEPLNPL